MIHQPEHILVIWETEAFMIWFSTETSQGATLKNALMTGGRRQESHTDGDEKLSQDPSVESPLWVEV